MGMTDRCHSPGRGTADWCGHHTSRLVGHFTEVEISFFLLRSARFKALRRAETQPASRYGRYVWPTRVLRLFSCHSANEWSRFIHGHCPGRLLSAALLILVWPIQPRGCRQTTWIYV